MVTTIVGASAPSVISGPRSAGALTARQLAALYSDFAAVRAYVAGTSEHITLIGPFAKRERPQRHAPRARFERWRRHAEAAALRPVYAHCPLLGGAP